MKVSFNLDVNDWVAFQQYHRGKKTPLYNLVTPLMACLIFFLVVLNVYVLFYLHMEVSSVNYISLFCILVLGYLLYVRKTAIDRVRQAGEDLKNKHPEAFGNTTMEFDDSGLELRSLQNSKSVSWDEMNRYEANKDYYFLFTKKGVVYIIPKKKIDVDFNAFEAMLNQHLKG